MMSNLSALVLVWLFGTWAFSAGELPASVMTQSTQVTPLVIFASIFATVGLAMFGLLGSWAVFIGIFRLRNNGNFFGARDGNESFFYPMRMVAAMALCAPVIPIASAGSEQIVLTPAHSMIAGLAKSGSEFGDEAQARSFRLMHQYNMLHEHNYVPTTDVARALPMLRNWRDSASAAAGEMVFKNPNGVMAGVEANELASELLRVQWAVSKPGKGVDIASVDPFLVSVVKMNQVPTIPPTDEITREYGYNTTAVDTDSAADQSVDREFGSENFMCEIVGASSSFCSDEMQALHKSNALAISVGEAAADRMVWQLIFSNEYARQILTNADITASQSEKFDGDSEKHLQELATWYEQQLKRRIQLSLAETNISSSEAYFKAMEEWGWMMGGTFVLRSANDFSKAQSLASAATSKLIPRHELSSLTVGDDLTKIAMGKIEERKQASPVVVKLMDILGLSILTADPAKANVSTVAAFGRELAGTGIAFFSGGGIAKLVSTGWVESAGKLGMLMGFCMLVAGALIGYVMPMVFAIYGIMGVISWLTFVASSFFGVSLWSAAFAAPKGEEHTSQMAAKGWNILIFIGLYPALAVGGLAAAVTVTSLALPLINILMGGVIGMTDNGVADLSQPFDAVAAALIGVITVTLATAMLFWSVCMTSASLITNFPRTVLNMVSFSEPGLNPYENTSQGVMGGIAGFVRAPVQMAVSGVVRDVAGRMARGRTPGDRNSGGGN